MAVGGKWFGEQKREDVGRWKALTGTLARGPNGPQGAIPPNQTSQAVSFKYGEELSVSATLIQHTPLVMNVHFEQSFMGAQR